MQPLPMLTYRFESVFIDFIIYLLKFSIITNIDILKYNASYTMLDRFIEFAKLILNLLRENASLHLRLKIYFL